MTSSFVGPGIGSGVGGAGPNGVPANGTTATGGTLGVGSNAAFEAQNQKLLAAADNSLTNINPNEPPAMKTLVYTPDVKILIAHGNKQFDVSNDISAFSVKRVENSVSSVAFQLANKSLDTGSKQPRYNQAFDRMDRVVVYLKRVEWIQVFSGYLDQVPYVQLYPGTVNFRASCTLKRLMHTWWNPSLPASVGIFNQKGLSDEEQAQGENLPDVGLGSMLRRLLVEVGHWSSTNVHVQEFPVGFFVFLEAQLGKLQKGNESNAEEVRRMLLGDGDTSGGVGAAAGRTAGIVRGGYVATQPERMMEVIRAVDERGMGPDNQSQAAAAGLATAAASNSNTQNQQPWTEVNQVGTNWQTAAKQNDAAVHAFMTVMAESNWLMYANNSVPESLGFPHDAIGSDHQSVGLFQQQPSWGSIAELMNPRGSAGLFLDKLKNYNWQNMPRAAACQLVQRSGTPDGSNYAKFEQTAIEAVNAIRTGQNSNQTTGGQTANIPGIGNVAPPVPIPGGAGAQGIPALPTQNGTPSISAAAGAAGAVQYDTAGALAFARTQLGKPYVWGAIGPASYDCSGLMLAAYRSIGIDLGRDTYAEARSMSHIAATSLQPGDLVQPDPGHVVMWTGMGTVVEAPQQGQNVQEIPIYFNPSNAVCLHAPGTVYGGAPVGSFDPSRAFVGGGAAPGTVAAGPDGGTTQTQSTEPVARNLFSWTFTPGQFAPTISHLYGGTDDQAEKAFIDAEPLMQTVSSFATAGMRKFQSAPNGDFVGYYPDYFGLDGKGAVMDIEDIEMINVQIDLNDDAMATHVYVAGANTATGAGGNAVIGWMQTSGVATVENEFLFRRMVLAAPRVPGEPLVSGTQIMERYGVRPLVQSMSNIQQGPMELMTAVQVFMTKWAEQYSTKIQLTFMPELYPGMRLNLVGHNLQVYVTEVTHCLRGSERFLTKNGTKTLEETAGTTQMVLGHHGEWTPAEINSFGQEETYKIVLSRYNKEKEVFATANHRWFKSRNHKDGYKFGRKTKGESQWVESFTTDLIAGDALRTTFKTLHQCRLSPVGIQAGIVFGDGTVHKGGKNPPLDESVSYLHGWLAGYFAADGNVTSDEGSSQAFITSSELKNVRLVQDVCHLIGIRTLSIVSWIDNSEGAFKKGSSKNRIQLDIEDLSEDFFLIEEHRERAMAVKSRWSQKGRRSMQNWIVKSVEPTGVTEEVYCATVPDGHAFTLEGNILTGNSGDWENGFTTEVVIMAPSNPAIRNLGVQIIGATGQENSNRNDVNGNASQWFFN